MSTRTQFAGLDQKIPSSRLRNTNGCQCREECLTFDNFSGRIGPPQELFSIAAFGFSPVRVILEESLLNRHEALSKPSLVF